MSANMRGLGRGGRKISLRRLVNVDRPDVVLSRSQLVVTVNRHINMHRNVHHMKCLKGAKSLFLGSLKQDLPR
jgi:hypothetical protein